MAYIIIIMTLPGINFQYKYLSVISRLKFESKQHNLFVTLRGSKTKYYKSLL